MTTAPEAVRRLVAATVSSPADVATHLSAIDPRDWPDLEPYVRDALVRAVRTFPDVTPNVAADLARHTAARAGDAANIALTLMEAVVRAAAGETDADRDVPPSMSAGYALLVVGQVVHEGRLTVDDAVGCGSSSPG